MPEETAETQAGEERVLSTGGDDAPQPQKGACHLRPACGLSVFLHGLAALMLFLPVTSAMQPAQDGGITVSLCAPGQAGGGDAPSGSEGGRAGSDGRVAAAQTDSRKGPKMEGPSEKKSGAPVEKPDAERKGKKEMPAPEDRKPVPAEKSDARSSRKSAETPPAAAEKPAEQKKLSAPQKPRNGTEKAEQQKRTAEPEKKRQNRESERKRNREQAQRQPRPDARPDAERGGSGQEGRAGKDAEKAAGAASDSGNAGSGVAAAGSAGSPARPGSGRVFTPGELDTPPKLLRRVTPMYPEKARSRGLNGRVVVRLTVSSEGKAVGVSVHSADPAGYFEEEALRAVARMRFSPGKKDGRAVDTLVLMPFDFHI